MTATTIANGYPSNWREISVAIRERAEARCECEGECGLHHRWRCEERNAEKAKWARGRVMLTVAHLNHTPSDCRAENLKAMCQRCHLRYDVDHHRETRSNRYRREKEAAGQLTLGVGT
ncbi:MAG: hypothetical protein ACT4PO_06175 [Actinomycetota bacterium]